jgi:hypothetical protein
MKLCSFKTSVGNYLPVSVEYRSVKLNIPELNSLEYQKKNVFNRHTPNSKKPIRCHRSCNLCNAQKIHHKHQVQKYAQNV